MKQVLGQLMRFGLVGVANTAVYYAFYRLFLLVMPYLPAHLIAWALSVVFSFFINCWFTFKVRPTLKKFLAFPSSTLVNLLFTTVGSVILVSGIGFDERYATVLMGIIAIPFTFALTRFILRDRVEHAAAPADDELPLEVEGGAPRS